MAKRLGAGLREARRRADLTQGQVGARADVAQAMVSLVERGAAPGVSLLVVSRLAQAVGSQLYAGLEAIPGAEPPRDAAHLAIVELVLRAAERGAWHPLPEAPLEDGRSIDVRLLHRRLRLAAVIEIWGWFADVGEATRGLDRKVAALRRELDRGRDIRAEPHTVTGLWVVRATKRNRALVREHGAFFRSRFSGDGERWIRALTGEGPPPAAPAMLWVDVRATRLWAARLGHSAGLPRQA